MRADVVVVGAGPAGAATATRLAASGLDVLVLDRARFPRDKACAEFLSPGAVGELASAGALEDAAAAGSWQRGMRIVSGGSEFSLAYEGGRRGLGIARRTLDALLVDRAAAAGARVHEGVAVTGAVVSGGRVVGVRVVAEDDSERIVEAGLVVGADGFRSPVARSLGLERPAPRPRRLGLVAHVRGAACDGVGLMAVGAGGYCGVASVGGAETSVGLAISPGDRRRGETVGELFDRSVAALPPARAALAGSERTTAIRGATPLARRVARVAGPGYLLVGDAAGATDPFTGEGVLRALRGAELAADAARAALLRTDRDPVGYAAARRAAFAAKDRACLLLQALLATPALLEYCLRRAARRPAAARGLAGVFGDYVPAESLFRPRLVADLLRP